MDAHKAIITTIFNNSTLIEVPFFQRKYVWKEDLWQRFIEDMEYVMLTNKPHFLGSIILKAGRSPRTGDNFAECKTLVDGQQRLTTFLIFLKVLCLKLGQPATFDSQYRIVGYEIALRHGKYDIDAFESVVSKDKAERINNAVGSLIIDVYNYFIDHIDGHKFDIMTIIRNIQFVRIDLRADEDAQQIFDTINSLGVNLTTSELLKNYFYSIETVNEYETQWVSVFEKDEDTRQYWDALFETGRIKRAMIDIFFDAYFTLFVNDKRFNVSNEDKISYARVDHLAQSYQHFVKNYCGDDKAVILNQLKDYANCFMQVFSPDQCNRCVGDSFGLDRLNIVIFGLKNTTLIPYVLYVAKNVLDEHEKNTIYGILESYIMRRIIVHADTKNYNRVFTSLINSNVLDAVSLLARLKRSNDATTYLPSDDELNYGFANSRLVNLHSKAVIYLIESKIRPNNVATVLMGFSQYSLEHLMPKKWRNNWGSLPSEESEQKRDSILLTLGNLAIITQSLNASIRDASWSVKKAGRNNKLGLNRCAAGLVTLFDVLEKSEWTEDDITERAMWLYKNACTIWSLDLSTEGSPQ